jgi:hypothetical protein
MYIMDLNEWIVHSDSAVASQSYMTTLEQMGRIKGTFLCETYIWISLLLIQITDLDSYL